MTNANETLERSLLELNLALAEILRAVKGAGLERAGIRAKLDAALVAVMSELEAGGSSVTEPQVDPEPMTRVDPEDLDARPFAALFDDGDDDDDDDEDDLF
ncbi:MAG: hypothetical protein KC457_07175 [Myxococcales bacterium]|nr:hypothetical protein [Myxococcales bacterium]